MRCIPCIPPKTPGSFATHFSPHPTSPARSLVVVVPPPWTTPGPLPGVSWFILESPSPSQYMLYPFATHPSVFPTALVYFLLPISVHLNLHRCDPHCISYSPPPAYPNASRMHPQLPTPIMTSAALPRPYPGASPFISSSHPQTTPSPSSAHPRSSHAFHSRASSTPTAPGPHHHTFRFTPRSPSPDRSQSLPNTSRLTHLTSLPVSPLHISVRPPFASRSSHHIAPAPSPIHFGVPLPSHRTPSAPPPAAHRRRSPCSSAASPSRSPCSRSLSRPRRSSRSRSPRSSPRTNPAARGAAAARPIAERRAPFCRSNARTLSRKAAKRSFRAANSVRSALRSAERPSTGTGGESRLRSRGGGKSRFIAAAGRGSRWLRGLTANGGSAPAGGRGTEEQREGNEGRGLGVGAGLPQVPPIAPRAQVRTAGC